MVDLHPYDGKTRVFTHTDADTSLGLALVARMLRRPADTLVDARYHLSFHSGGMGIYDQLAISVACDDPPEVVAQQRRDLWSPEAAAVDPRVKDDFLWLIDDEDAPLPPVEAAVRFVNAERQAFQPACFAGALWFDGASGVNTWSVLWLAEGRLCYRGFDQG